MRSLPLSTPLTSAVFNREAPLPSPLACIQQETAWHSRQLQCWSWLDDGVTAFAIVHDDREAHVRRGLALSSSPSLSWHSSGCSSTTSFAFHRLQRWHAIARDQLQRVESVISQNDEDVYPYNWEKQLCLSLTTSRRPNRLDREPLDWSLARIVSRVLGALRAFPGVSVVPDSWWRSLLRSILASVYLFFSYTYIHFLSLPSLSLFFSSSFSFSLLLFLSLYMYIFFYNDYILFFFFDLKMQKLTHETHVCARVFKRIGTRVYRFSSSFIRYRSCGLFIKHIIYVTLYTYICVTYETLVPNKILTFNFET